MSESTSSQKKSVKMSGIGKPVTQTMAKVIKMKVNCVSSLASMLAIRGASEDLDAVIEFMMDLVFIDGSKEGE